MLLKLKKCSAALLDVVISSETIVMLHHQTIEKDLVAWPSDTSHEIETNSNCYTRSDAIFVGVLNTILAQIQFGALRSKEARCSLFHCTTRQSTCTQGQKAHVCQDQSLTKLHKFPSFLCTSWGNRGPLRPRYRETTKQNAKKKQGCRKRKIV